MSDLALRFWQTIIFFTVFFGTIWAGITLEYPINPYFPPAFGFMAAYGFTLAQAALGDLLSRFRNRRLPVPAGVPAGTAAERYGDGDIFSGLSPCVREAFELSPELGIRDQLRDLRDIAGHPPAFEDIKRLAGPSEPAAGRDR